MAWCDGVPLIGQASSIQLIHGRSFLSNEIRREALHCCNCINRIMELKWSKALNQFWDVTNSCDYSNFEQYFMTPLIVYTTL